MEGELNLLVKLILSIVLGGFVWLLFHLYNGVLAKPKKLRLKLQNQGIKGPCPFFIWENIHEMRRIQLQALSAANSRQKDRKAVIAHDWFPTLFPFKIFMSLHSPSFLVAGYVFLYSTGNLQLLYTTDVEMLKEIGLRKSFNLREAVLSN
ncbi:hypothetical protein CRYUN_Cryun14cG0009200 [Craigia yunnanensis]